MLLFDIFYVIIFFIAAKHPHLLQTEQRLIIMKKEKENIKNRISEEWHIPRESEEE